MILLAEFWENPAVVGLVLAIPATVLGYLGYRRSLKVDEAAKQAGIATSQSVSVGQAVDGLNRVIAALQEDNEILRKDVKDLRAGVELIQARLDVVESGNLDLVAKLRETERENVILHAENEALKLKIEKLEARIDELERGNGP